MWIRDADVGRTFPALEDDLRHIEIGLRATGPCRAAPLRTEDRGYGRSTQFRLGSIWRFRQSSVTVITSALSLVLKHAQNDAFLFRSSQLPGRGWSGHRAAERVGYPSALTETWTGFSGTTGNARNAMPAVSTGCNYKGASS